MKRAGAARRIGVFAASWLVLGLPSLAWSAEPAPEAASSFAAGFFTQYNPTTAADMVARVPGFDLQDGAERRGFAASSGNLLINGERPSSKAVPSEILKRIPAGAVVRIELLSGSDAGSDIRGQSQIVNVVVDPSALQGGATTVAAGLRYIQYSNRVGWAFQASRSFALSPNADLAVDIQAPNTLGRSVNREVLLSGADVVQGFRYQYGQARNMSLQGSAHLNWRATPLDTVNVNLQYVPIWNSGVNAQYESAVSGALRGHVEGETEYDNNYTTEVGGDWEHRFSPVLSLKLIGLVSNTSVDQTDRYEIHTAPASDLVRTQARTTRSGERIARAQVKWGALTGHALELGAEGAFNFRDTTLDIVSQAPGGPPVRTPLPVANARVEEVRGEVFASDSWQASPVLTLEAGVNFEFSKISQTGDQQQERKFNYLKPRVSATYVVSPRNTLRFSLLRDVAQLDFAEFSSAVDFFNASAIQGNPDLVPETAWKARLEWDTRLASRTALTLALFADRVQDVHDLVDIAGFDAYGNIGDGTRLGVEVRGSTPLGFLGRPNAELRFSGLYQQTRVTDPITGEDRSFSVPVERQGTPSGSATLNGGNKDWAYLVNFRDNLPNISSAWGATLVQWAGRDEYRRAEAFHYVRKTPRLDLFFETTAIKPVTIRLYANNVLVSSEDRTRTFYLGDRASGVVQRYELREGLGGPEASRTYGFLISGRF